MRTRKFFLLTVVAVFLVIGGISVLKPSPLQHLENVATPGAGLFEEEEAYTLVYKGEDGKTALEILQEAATVEVKGRGENAFVVAINGRKADERRREYWSFWVNKEMAQVGAGSYKTKSGDTIEWKIDTY